MNIAELLKLIQQVETGKVISVVKENVEVINEAQNNPVIEQIHNLKLILTAVIIAIVLISTFTSMTSYEADLSNIVGKLMFGVIAAFFINFGIDSTIKEYIPNTAGENKQTKVVEKEVRKNATDDEINSWKKQVLTDIKNHRKTKNAKIPIKTINIAKNYLYYIRHNSKENEM